MDSWTKVQREIFKFLSLNAGKTYTKREISKRINVSPTAISKGIGALEKNEIITIELKNKNYSEVGLNTEKERVVEMRRVLNLGEIYSSEIVRFLEEKFPGTTLILFGSYSRGEDKFNSDIDLAIIGSKEKEIDLNRFEKFFKKEIRLQFYDSFSKINKHFRENLYSGILLFGRIGL